MLCLVRKQELGHSKMAKIHQPYISQDVYFYLLSRDTVLRSELGKVGAVGPGELTALVAVRELLAGRYSPAFQLTRR